MSNQKPDLISTARRAGGFDTFITAIDAAGMIDLLQGVSPHTMFAPTDEAFVALPAATLQKLMSKDQSVLLRAVVATHLVAGRISSQRMRGRHIRGKSVHGGDLRIAGDEEIKVNGAAIVRPDIGARNGVVHGISRVLWPQVERTAGAAVVA